jgi:CheY-like chemotaxis protein
MASVRVLLVDDVAAFRKLVSTALRLRGGFEVVGEAADGAGAVAMSAQMAPDVIVLDLGLPDIAGTELIGLLRSRSPGSKIVVFSGRDDGDAVHSVEGYVRKDDDVRLLVDVLVDVTAERVSAGAALRLAEDITSAARARRFVEEQCTAWGFHAVLDDALLVVSELVTNAVVHGESEAELRLIPGQGILRIEVADDGEAAPDPRLAGDDDEHGRGLLLISVLSTAWGTEAAPGGGKVVWADLPVANEPQRVA